MTVPFTAKMWAPDDHAGQVNSRMADGGYRGSTRGTVSILLVLASRVYSARHMILANDVVGLIPWTFLGQQVFMRSVRNGRLRRCDGVLRTCIRDIDTCIFKSQPHTHTHHLYFIN